jgi:uncharacterized protein (TIGR00252 family)
MNTTSVGQAAEAAAAQHLQSKGFKIIARNWRRPSCEIDLIAQKARVVYFIEVKYRTSQSQGSGIDYITPKKLKQLKHAAEVWLSENDWTGDCRLLAIEVKADQLKPVVENIIEI